jgi:hypothetical protein
VHRRPPAEPQQEDQGDQGQHSEYRCARTGGPARNDGRQRTHAQRRKAVAVSLSSSVCRRGWISLCPQMIAQSSSVRHSELPIGHSKVRPDSDYPVGLLPFLHGNVGSLKLEHRSAWTDFLKVSSSGINNPLSKYSHDFAADISSLNRFASMTFESSWIDYHFLHAKVSRIHYAVRP